MEKLPKSERISNVLCACGCGMHTALRYGKSNKYVVGHNPSRLGTAKTAEFVCIHCGGTFAARPLGIEKRRFCAMKCRDAYRAIHTGEEHPSYKRVDYECPVCGVVYPARPGLVRQGKTFCSTTCGQRSRSLKLSALQLVPGSWTYGKTLAMRRDGFACLVCGFDAVLHVHHITPRSKGGDHSIENLATLCPNHHAMVHRRLLAVQDVLGLIAAKTK